MQKNKKAITKNNSASTKSSEGSLVNSNDPIIDFLKEKGASQEVISEAISIKESYSGPIPHPRLLQQFDQIVPGAAKQIIDQALSETAHRQSLENKSMDANIELTNSDSRLRFWGQLIAGVLSTLLIVGSFILGMNDKTATSVTFLGVGAVSLIGLFINKRYNKKDKDKDSHTP